MALLLPGIGSRNISVTHSDVVIACFFMVMSSFAWGYGISGLWFVLFEWKSLRQRRLDQGLCVNRGYDLRASKNRCPEFGTSIPKR